MSAELPEDEILDRLTGRYSYTAGIDTGPRDSTLVVGHTDGDGILHIDRVVRLPDIDALLELINDGSYDEHLEAILAAGHARKRERRGVRRPHGLVR